MTKKQIQQKDDKKIIIGEFLVDSDGELFIDPTGDPLENLEQEYRFQKIKELQRKLQKRKGRQLPPNPTDSSSKKR